MTDEEIRMRCLELAFPYSGRCEDTYTLANEFYDYVTRDRLLGKTDKIVWDKISNERKD